MDNFKEPLFQLPLSLPRRGSRRILASLHLQLRSAILDGRLATGSRLPSTRALARLCRVSRNTTIAAYDLLTSEGYVTASRGSGTRVGAVAVRSQRRETRDAGTVLRRRLHPFWRRCPAPAAPAARSGPRFSFQLGIPDVRHFPYAVWRTLTSRVLRQRARHPVVAGDPQGLASCRQAIAAHVSFTRAVACSAEDIVITAGAQQAFDLLAQVLTVPGRSVVAIEEPCYPPLRTAFLAKGARIRPVPVDEDGLQVGRIPAGAGVICVTPSHQFPLGCAMSAARRSELLQVCRRRGAVVIEDDYDGEFRFEDRPLDALQTLDAAQCVFYVGTFSKTLLPDLRLGYIVAPPWALDALVAAKRAAGDQSGSMQQSVLAMLIAEGHLARHVRRMQGLYGLRRQALLDGLRHHLGPWLTPIRSLAGLHVTARLAGRCDEAAVVQAALAQDVMVRPLRPYFTDRPTVRGLLFGLGAIDEKAIPEALSRLRRALPG